MPVKVFVSAPDIEAVRAWCLDRRGTTYCNRCAVDGCDKTTTLSACRACGKVQYCGREHQTAHWRAKHRAECDAMKKPVVKGMEKVAIILEGTEAFQGINRDVMARIQDNINSAVADDGVSVSVKIINGRTVFDVLEP